MSIAPIYKCSRCSYSEFEGSVHTHHIDSNRANNITENLILLYSNCHYGLHHGDWKLNELCNNHIHPPLKSVRIRRNIIDANMIEHTCIIRKCTASMAGKILGYWTHEPLPSQSLLRCYLPIPCGRSYSGNRANLSCRIAGSSPDGIWIYDVLLYGAGP